MSQSAGSAMAAVWASTGIRGVGNPNNDHVIPEAPGDTVSCIAWSPSSNLLAATAWDRTVRVWEVRGTGSDLQSNALAVCSAEAPLLSCCFSRDGQWLATGGCHDRVRLRDMRAEQDLDVGIHAGPVKSVAILENDLILSGSWDKTLCLWKGNQQRAVQTIALQERVYAMDVKYPMAVVATAGRRIYAFNLATLQHRPDPEWQVESKLNMQTKSISLFPDRTGFALGSVEGRCAIQYVPDEAKGFCFKCHRTDKTVNTVGAIDFMPGKQNVFATAGSDGSFTYWDKNQRQRIKSFSSCYYPITAAKFNSSGELFAYAVGYDWSQGPDMFNPDLPTEVFVHFNDDSALTRRNFS